MSLFCERDSSGFNRLLNIFITEQIVFDPNKIQLIREMPENYDLLYALFVFMMNNRGLARMNVDLQNPNMFPSMNGGVYTDVMYFDITSHLDHQTHRQIGKKLLADLSLHLPNTQGHSNGKKSHNIFVVTPMLFASDNTLQTRMQLHPHSQWPSFTSYICDLAQQHLRMSERDFYSLFEHNGYHK